MIATWVGAIALSIWIYLIAGRGGFWRVRETMPPKWDGAPRRIAVVIPARNEASSVGQAVRSLLAQDYAGPVRIILVDDCSSDGTAEVAREAAAAAGANSRLTIVQARPLPKGWTGKLWAVAEGLQEAAGADYLLLTDADVVHAPENVRELAARAETGGLDLASLMVKLRCESLAERALIPAFVFFFFKLYPPSWIARQDDKTAGAAGGCVLIRPAALDRIGGIAAIRSELIDDCSLAAAVKRSGGRIWLGATSRTHSIRDYKTFREIERMVSRTAFTQLKHSIPLLAGTVIGMALTYLAPPLLFLLASPPAAWLGLAAWILMAAAYWPTLRFYRRSALWAPLLPLVALFYVAATVHSAWSYWRGRGGAWKGRVQDVKSR